MIPPFVFAWAVTVAIEAPCVAALYPGQRRRMALICAIATSVTNVVMNVALPRWLGVGVTFLLVGEIGALLVEAAVYALAARPRDVGRALAASALANGLSFSVGLLLPNTV